MKRFILFGGQTYYAAGGFHDFKSSHDTLPQALTEAHRLEALPSMDAVDWWHIFDSHLGNVVVMSKSTAHGAPNRLPDLNEVAR